MTGIKIKLFIAALLLPASIFHALTGTVNAGAPFTKDAAGRELITNLMPGSIVSVEKVQGTVCRIQYRGQKGFIRTAQLAFYDRLFSNIENRVLLSSRFIYENNAWHVFYYKPGKLVKFNTVNRSVADSRKLENLSEIHPSPRNDLFLLEGVVTNGGRATHHFALYYFQSGRMLYIGGFDEETVKITAITFSPAANYVALTFRADGEYYSSVYRTDNGERIAVARKASGASWLGQTLVLSDTASFWAASITDMSLDTDISWRRESELVKVKPEWISAGKVDSAVVKDILLVDAPSGSLRIDPAERKILTTPYRGLLLNDDLSLNYDMRGESAWLKNLAQNRLLPGFQGGNPEIDFVAFSGTNIIGKRRYEKVDTLFLYSPEGKELYRYKAIDAPMAMAPNGYIAEISTDRNMLLLSVEDPVTGRLMFYMEELKN